MIKANYSILTTILSVLPHYKSNADVISNAVEAVKILDNNLVDAREISLMGCIKTMLQYLINSVEFNDKNLITMSTPDEKTAEDIYVKCKSATEDTKDFVRKYLDFIAMQGDILKSSEELSEALEEVQSAPNFEVLPALNKLTSTVEKIVNKIDKKTTKKENRSVIFGKKMKGVGTIIEQLRYEDKNALSSGIPALDEISGKYKPKKLYCTIALTGGFKSGFLENMTLGMRVSNRNMEKIPGLENAILHLTFENDLLQVFKRFIDYSMEEKFFSRKKLNRMSDDEILNLAGECLAPKVEGDMSVVVQQYPRYSIKPADIAGIVSSLRRDGVRVCAVVVDYADLMAAPEYDEGDTEDKAKTPLVRKFEALKLLAQKLSVPILTAGQFNRMGEAEAKLARKKYPSPLLGGLNASHVAGGYGLKYHVETMFIQFRGSYNGVELLHMLLEKDRDGNADDSAESKEANEGQVLRFFKFKKNGFRISDDPNDVYKDIRDVVPINDGGIISSAFQAMTLDEDLVNKLKEKDKANQDLLSKL